LRFLVDAQLPPALARQIGSLGHEAEHVADSGRARATDTAIRAYAAETGAVIVTKDEDFAVHMGSMTRSYCGGRYGPRSRSAICQIKFAK